MEITEGGSEPIARKDVNFPAVYGVRVADSLAFGLIRKIGKARLQDHFSPVMLPCQRYISHVVEWEESLPIVQIVQVLDEDWEQVVEMEPARKSILKKFNANEIRYNVHQYNPDPDMKDRGKLRFPQLNTVMRQGISRTAPRLKNCLLLEIDVWS